MELKELARASVKHHGDAPCVDKNGEPKEGCTRSLLELLQSVERDTRHACAVAVLGMDGRSHGFGNNPCIRQREAHQVVVNSSPPSKLRGFYRSYRRLSDA